MKFLIFLSTVFAMIFLTSCNEMVPQTNYKDTDNLEATGSPQGKTQAKSNAGTVLTEYLYQAVLWKPASGSTARVYVNMINSQGFDGLSQAASAISTSSDFRNNIQNRKTPQEIFNRLFQILLGRLPELAANSALPAIQAGDTRSVVLGIINSEEFKGRISSLLNGKSAGPVNPPSPQPITQPVPAPVPAPAPAPQSPGQTQFPAGDPRNDLPPGPIVRYTVGVYYARRPDGSIYRPQQSGNNYTMNVGDTLFTDSTQKNSNNRPCQWQQEPQWTLQVSGGFRQGGTSNPFLLKFNNSGPGRVVIKGVVDGIWSNEIAVEAK